MRYLLDTNAVIALIKSADSVIARVAHVNTTLPACSSQRS